VKNNQDNKIQNITLCNRYFSEKGICDAKPPEAGELSRIFVLKVTLQSLRFISKGFF